MPRKPELDVEQSKKKDRKKAVTRPNMDAVDWLLAIDILPT